MGIKKIRFGPQVTDPGKKVSVKKNVWWTQSIFLDPHLYISV